MRLRSSGLVLKRIMAALTAASVFAATGWIAVASSPARTPAHAASLKYCGKFTARNESDPKHPSQAYTLYTYRLSGSVTCTKTVQLLKEWFQDKHQTQHYGPWFCEDDNGPRAERGWVQECRKGGSQGARISDRFHKK